MLIREDNSVLVFEDVIAERLDEAADALLEHGSEYSVWMFNGEMGAGKTTLIRALCKRLGVKDEVSSPTFPIVQEYQTIEGETIYHFDFYRIRSEEEASDIGVDEYFHSDDYCFIEWPEKVRSLWPDSYLEIEIIILNENTRTIRLTRHDG
jgi:tRNA threonylcarbamoyladenosine biosynthesis protein TsaE